MQIKKIELYTADLALVDRFYGTVLQLPVVAKSNTAISFRIGYSELTFVAAPAPAGPYHFAFLIPKNQVAQAYQWIKTRIPVLPFTAHTDMADFHVLNARAFYFHDGEQNILELIAHNDLPYESGDAFSQHSIIGICEMGVVVDDVAAGCYRLHQEYGIPYFTKVPASNDFAMMGEEDGLLIVSQTGRGWLPIGQPAVQKGFKAFLQIRNKGFEVPF